MSLVLANMVYRALTKPGQRKCRSRPARLPKDTTQGPWEVYGEDELGQLAALMRIDLSDDVADAQESIDAERRRLDSVLTHMTDGVVATDRRGKIMIINEMAQSMLDEGTEIKRLEKICPVQLLDVGRRHYLLAPCSGKTAMMSSSTAHNNGVPDQLLRATLHNWFEKNPANHQRESVCVHCHDVTEQERIEEERKQFVSNVSHELRRTSGRR
ncbi:MAG: hypothetical protein U5K84_13375 [Alkalibacterium sp.]|nr:hypothetical protein [Alkalibacterium sp.]